MKTVSKYLLPRYVWFLIWFKQWFRNTEGIKGFADQIMMWLMRSTLALAKKLKGVNKRLEERIKAKRVLLAEWYQHAVIKADEYDDIRSFVIKLGLWLTAATIAEAALNYFGVSAVITAKGWGWIALNSVIALVFTGLDIYIFKQWFAEVLNLPLYKKTEVKPRNIVKLILLTVLCIAFEGGIYYLCRIRGEALEGTNQSGFVTLFITIAGMLLPIIAAYMAYERSRYISAYRNTNRISRAERLIDKWSKKIAANNDYMDKHFNQEVQEYWGLLMEFKVYKENYNLKNGIKEEDLFGHFAADHNSFVAEAQKRYHKEMLQFAPLQPTVIITKPQMNGHAIGLPESTNK